jgi:hypothetical protein
VRLDGDNTGELSRLHQQSSTKTTTQEQCQMFWKRRKQSPKSDLDSVLLSFDRHTPWTFRDAFEGTCILGGNGSGKTSGRVTSSSGSSSSTTSCGKNPSAY